MPKSKSFSPVHTPPTVAILAGGLGTRLRPLISEVPKSLANIAGEPFLFLLLRSLARYGIKKVLLLTGYMHDKIAAACGNGEAFNLEIQYSCEREPLGTAGALAHAAPILEQETEFILLNGDTFLQAELDGFIGCILHPCFYGIVGIVKNNEYERYGSVQIDDKGVIEAFCEKEAKPTGFINAGIYKLSPKIFSLIPKETVCSLERDIFPRIIAENKARGLEAYVLDGTLHDIGTPESYTAFYTAFNK